MWLASCRWAASDTPPVSESGAPSSPSSPPPGSERVPDACSSSSPPPPAGQPWSAARARTPDPRCAARPTAARRARTRAPCHACARSAPSAARVRVRSAASARRADPAFAARVPRKAGPTTRARKRGAVEPSSGQQRASSHRRGRAQSQSQHSNAASWAATPARDCSRMQRSTANTPSLSGRSSVSASARRLDPGRRAACLSRGGAPPCDSGARWETWRRAASGTAKQAQKARQLCPAPTAVGAAPARPQSALVGASLPTVTRSASPTLAAVARAEKEGACEVVAPAWRAPWLLPPSHWPSPVCGCSVSPSSSSSSSSSSSLSASLPTSSASMEPLWGTETLHQPEEGDTGAAGEAVRSPAPAPYTLPREGHARPTAQVRGARAHAAASGRRGRRWRGRGGPCAMTRARLTTKGGAGETGPAKTPPALPGAVR